MIDASETVTTQHPAPEPEMDRDAQLAALLAAKGVITTKEAADLTGHSEEKLAAEVEAWAVVAEPKH